MAQQNKVLGIVGRNGSGKSTHLREILEPRSRIFVFDVMADHADWLPNVIRDFKELDYFLGRAAPQRTWAVSFVHEFELEKSFELVSARVFKRLYRKRARAPCSRSPLQWKRASDTSLTFMTMT